MFRPPFMETLEPRLMLSATVDGFVFFDANVSGVMDGGEPGLEGWRVFVDLNEDGQWQPGEPNAITNAEGAYLLEVSSGVPMILMVEPQEGWVQTMPGHVFYNATFESGGSYDDEGFTYQPHPDAPGAQNLWHATNVQWYSGAGWSQYFGITGQWNYNTGERVAGMLVSPVISLPDVLSVEMSFLYWLSTSDNNDPDYDIPLVQLSNDGGDTWITVAESMGGGLFDSNQHMYRWEGNLSAFAGQDVQVRFAFDSVDAKNNAAYGWFIDNIQFRSSEFGSYTGQLQSGGAYPGVNFGVFRDDTGKIEGHIYNDANGNGQFDEGDTGLAGRMVYLDLNNNGVFDEGEPFAMTGENGYYVFENLPAGTYTVAQVQEPGWVATSPDGSGSAPEFATPLTDVWWTYDTTGGGLTFGVDGYDADGDPLTLQVHTGSPLLGATVPEGNRYALFHIVDDNGQPVGGDGQILVQLFEGRSPLATERFTILSENHVNPDGTYYPSDTDAFYTDVLIHRIIQNFMWQSGDAVNGDGTGGSPLGAFADQFDPVLSFAWRGALALANSGPNTNNSQFFLTDAPTPWLDGKHTIFGQVVSGWDVYDLIISATTGPNNVPVSPLYIAGIDIVQSPQDGTVTLTGPFNWIGETTIDISLTDPNGNTVIETIAVNGHTGEVTPVAGTQTTTLHGVHRVTVGAFETASGINFGNALDYVLGDFNGDGVLSGLDIPGFKQALADPDGWAAANPGMPHPNILGDFNGDGVFSGLDIPGFKQALAGGAVALSAPVADGGDDSGDSSGVVAFSASLSTAASSSTETTADTLRHETAWMEYRRLRTARDCAPSASEVLLSLLRFDGADKSTREVAATGHGAVESGVEVDAVGESAVEEDVYVV